MKRIGWPVALLLLTAMLFGSVAFAEEPDGYAVAASQFARASGYFTEIVGIAEGSVQKGAQSAAGNASAAANAARSLDAAGAISCASRAKLDAVLAAASVNTHKDIDAAVLRFDGQVAAYESAPAEEKPAQLAQAAAQFAALARALRDAVLEP